MSPEQIVNLTDSWLDFFGYGDWEITYTWVADDNTAWAETATEADWNKATITYNVGRMQTEKPDDEKVLSIILHEVLHVILSPYTEMARTMVHKKRLQNALTKVEETLVGHLTSSILRRYDVLEQHGRDASGSSDDPLSQQDYCRLAAHECAPTETE